MAIILLMNILTLFATRFTNQNLLDVESIGVKTEKGKSYISKDIEFDIQNNIELDNKIEKKSNGDPNQGNNGKANSSFSKLILIFVSCSVLFGCGCLYVRDYCCPKKVFSTYSPEPVTMQQQQTQVIVTVAAPAQPYPMQTYQQQQYPGQQYPGQPQYMPNVYQGHIPSQEYGQSYPTALPNHLQSGFQNEPDNHYHINPEDVKDTDPNPYDNL